VLTKSLVLQKYSNFGSQSSSSALSLDIISISLDRCSFSSLGYLDFSTLVSSASDNGLIWITTNLDSVAGLNALAQIYLSAGLAVANILASV